jgi:protein-L-isoaspartate(D-aspartate) O-methyltransferase
MAYTEMRLQRDSPETEATAAVERADMLALIEAEARATASYTGRPVFNRRVMTAMAKVPRHKFVPNSEESLAYINAALPIGHGQTISQPYIVALMTDLLDLSEESVVLEVGTGSGYQAAVLAEIAKQVYSLEIVAELAEEARVRLQRLGITKVEVRTGDGYYGWLEHAPFDGIIVTAATAEIPPPLIEQLKCGGRLVIPVGRPFVGQDLMVVEKDEAGEVSSRSVLPVAFVPFRRDKYAEQVKGEE